MRALDSWLTISLLFCICWILSRLLGPLLMGSADQDEEQPDGCIGCLYAGTCHCNDSCNWYWLDD